MTHPAERCEAVGVPRGDGRATTVLYRCPACPRETRQNMSYLGGREVWCDGARWSKRRTMGGAVHGS